MLTCLCPSGEDDERQNYGVNGNESGEFIRAGRSYPGKYQDKGAYHTPSGPSANVKAGMLIKVLEDINISKHEDIRRAHQNGRPEFLLDMEKAIRAGEGTERIRERRMGWSVLQRGSVAISLPESFVTGKLGNLFGPAPPEPAPES